MPMFGAPRTARRRIASAVSSAPVELDPALLGAGAASGRGSTGAGRPSAARRSRGGRPCRDVYATAPGSWVASAPCPAPPAPSRRPSPCSPPAPRPPSSRRVRRPDHAALRGRAGHALHGLVGHPRHRDRVRSTPRSSTSSPATPPTARRGSSSASAAPAIDATGIGPGFSGSPIYCTGRRDRQNAGAIAEGIGDYGDKVVLATPIEQMLGEPVDPPPARRRTPGAAAPARARWRRR